MILLDSYPVLRFPRLEDATQGIRVNSVCPGAVRTAPIIGILEEDLAQEQAIAALQPVERSGEPEENCRSHSRAEYREAVLCYRSRDVGG